MKKKVLNYMLLIIGFIVLLLLICAPQLIENKDADIINKITFILSSIIELGIFFIPIIVVMIAKRKAKKKVIRESLSEIDFKNNKEYYRDVLINYTPGIISYIDDFEISYPQDIVAIILNLELKKVIKIENNNIVILNKEVNNLKKCEQYILDNIEGGKLKITSMRDIESYIIDDCIDSNLITKNKDKVKRKNRLGIINIMVIGMSLFWIGFFILNMFFQEEFLDFLNNYVLLNIDKIMVYIVIIVFILAIIRYIRLYIIVHEVSYVTYKNKSYIRSDEGEELNRKVEGLKNYIKDFGNLSEKERSELLLWEDYLIYSVIFGVNTNIIKEISPLID